MAKDTEERVKDILRVIQDYKLCRIKHIFGYYTGLSMPYFYELGLNKNERLLNALEQNRTKTTTSMLLNWTKNPNPALQIAAMKLLSDDEDRQKLAQAYVEQKVTQSHTVAELESEVAAGSYTDEEKAVMLNVARKSRGLYDTK